MLALPSSGIEQTWPGFLVPNSRGRALELIPVICCRRSCECRATKLLPHLGEVCRYHGGSETALDSRTYLDKAELTRIDQLAISFSVFCVPADWACLIRSASCKNRRELAHGPLIPSLCLMFLTSKISVILGTTPQSPCCII